MDSANNGVVLVSRNEILREGLKSVMAEASSLQFITVEMQGLADGIQHNRSKWNKYHRRHHH